jgi:hypothetical protein
MTDSDYAEYEVVCDSQNSRFYERACPLKL